MDEKFPSTFVECKIEIFAIVYRLQHLAPFVSFGCMQSAARLNFITLCASMPNRIQNSMAWRWNECLQYYRIKLWKKNNLLAAFVASRAVVFSVSGSMPVRRWPAGTRGDRPRFASWGMRTIPGWLFRTHYPSMKNYDHGSNWAHCSTFPLFLRFR